MSDAVFNVDFKEFDRAMVEYSAASRKDFTTSLHRSLNNLAIQGMKIQKVAEKSAIETLEDKAWWPKLIAKLMRKKFSANIGRMFKKAKKDSTRSRLSLRMARASTSGRGFYTREQARAYSLKLIRRRLRAVSFLKFFFAAMSKAVAPFAKVPAKASKGFSGFQVNFRPATPTFLTTQCEVKYEYNKRTARTAKKTMRLLSETLSKAIPATVLDMQKYIQRQVEKNSRQYSARGAA